MTASTGSTAGGIGPGTRKKVILLCNYLPDAQQSMRRFDELLQRTLPLRGWDVAVVRPPSLLTRFTHGVSNRGLAKWLGYIDKYLLFPWILKGMIRREAKGLEGQVLVHIIDHSNALYTPRHSWLPWVVTCHDLIAVRGGLGENTDCPASALGRQLQRWITRGLSLADAIACDSTSTLEDVQRIITPVRTQNRQVILLGQNHPYRQVAREDALQRLRGVGPAPWEEPFVLHVGSNLPRKNKDGILRIFAHLRDRWAGNLIFCGPPLPAELLAQIEAAGLGGRVHVVSNLENAQLEAAYNLAHAFIFPSSFEGFGWPIIEAQACGCPVICSNTTSLPEVGGDAALVHPLDDETGMADAVLRLNDPQFRSEVIRRGIVNLDRFTQARMLDEYVGFYERALGEGARVPAMASV